MRSPRIALMAVLLLAVSSRSWSAECARAIAQTSSDISPWASATIGGPLPPPLPLFPATNWWNLDISSAPLDPNSTNFINFINQGSVKHLHPDFGGEVSPGSVQIYGFPYIVTDSSEARVAVNFGSSGDESDGVNHNTNQSYPFYP